MRPQRGASWRLDRRPAARFNSLPSRNISQESPFLGFTDETLGCTTKPECARPRKRGQPIGWVILLATPPAA